MIQDKARVKKALDNVYLAHTQFESFCKEPIDDRNKTSHIYHKALAEEILDRILKSYQGLFKKTIVRLKT